MEAGLCRRPYWIQLGNSTMREAHCKDLHTMEAGLSRRLSWIQLGKPDNARGPLHASRYTGKPVYAGDLIACRREARQTEEADYKYIHRIQGSRSMPDAILRVEGKPDKPRSPMMNIYMRYMEAGPCRIPYGVYKRSSTKREAR